MNLHVGIFLEAAPFLSPLSCASRQVASSETAWALSARKSPSFADPKKTQCSATS